MIFMINLSIKRSQSYIQFYLQYFSLLDYILA